MAADPQGLPAFGKPPVGEVVLAVHFDPPLKLQVFSISQLWEKWRGRFQSEFTAQHALRFVAQRMRDTDIDALFTLATTDGILPLVRQTARFNRHRDFILALLRHQPARRALFGRLASPI